MAIVETMVDASVGHVIDVVGGEHSVLSGRERDGGGRGNDIDRVHAVLLVRAEEMCLVRRDRPTERAAETILGKRRLRRREEILRIQGIVASEVHCGATEAVCAALRDD